MQRHFSTLRPGQCLFGITWFQLDDRIGAIFTCIGWMYLDTCFRCINSCRLCIRLYIHFVFSFRYYYLCELDTVWVTIYCCFLRAFSTIGSCTAIGACLCRVRSIFQWTDCKRRLSSVDLSHPRHRRSDASPSTSRNGLFWDMFQICPLQQCQRHPKDRFRHGGSSGAEKRFCAAAK